jgi:hypothetical protein
VGVMMRPILLPLGKRYIQTRVYSIKCNKQGMCVTLWPCHLHEKSILKAKKRRRINGIP